ncbi:MAG: Uncharacterized protein G01um10147_75 [Microgenomates group bacterium Gr01-1014_7]|nr:MAG: Uncharacterized protein G01um10147_75 [Microgenomates group bacterium Gr01-1014_7]
MNFVWKYQREIIVLVCLIIAYFILRLPNLTLQPIFADEAIYIRWAQVMRSEPTLRFLPQTDGKTPLFMWSLIPLFKFIHDPLLAGRFLSVLSGFFTLLGVFFLSRKVFNAKAALWASLVYVITPYTVFFDRMALVDSMLSAFTVWVVYFAVWLLKSLRLDLAMILGYMLGGAILTKTPGMLNLLILPVSILGFKKAGAGKYRLVKLVAFWGVAVVIALVMYNLLRLGPEFRQLSARNADYVFSPVELVGRPLDPFIPHFHDISDWFPKLLTWPIIGLMVYGLWFMVKEKNKLGWVILAWAIIPLLVEMTFLRTFTARYLLPSIPLLLILAGFGMEKISRVIPLIILLILVVFLPLKFDYQLLTNPPPDSLPNEERKGYFEDWTAGFGLKDIAGFLKEKRKEGKVIVGTEGSFGTLPDGLWIYLDKDDIAIIGGSATISAQIRDTARENATYFVGNKKNLKLVIQKAELVREYPKARPLDGSEQDAMVLYKVFP